MKKQLLLFLLIFQSSLYCQVNIDNDVTIKFPAKNEVQVENTQGFSTKIFFLNTTYDSFFTMRLEGISKPLPLANDEADLEECYRVISKETIEKLNNKGLIKSSEKFISFKGYTAYQIELCDKSNKTKNGECLVLLVNQVAYFFIYSKIEKYVEKRKTAFMSSIEIKENLPQYKEKYNYLTAILKIFLLGFFILLIRRYLKKNKAAKASS